MDFTPGKVQFQQAQNRQSLDNVSQRTRFENEDFQGASAAGTWHAERRTYLPSARRSASRGGRPAAMILAWAAGMS